MPTKSTHPVITSLTDLVPSFPLSNDEAVLKTSNGTEKAQVIVPTGISPVTDPESESHARYYVECDVYSVVQVLENDVHMIPGSVECTETRSIRSLTTLIDNGHIISLPEDTITPGEHESRNDTERDFDKGFENATVYFDGASRGNPGEAATGYVVENPHLSVAIEGGTVFDELTNNEAEYHALIEALEAAVNIGVSTVTVKGDSQLIIRQVTGKYDCNADNLKPLLKRTRSILDEFDSWEIEHVDRSNNSVADGIANKQLDNN